MAKKKQPPIEIDKESEDFELDDEFDEGKEPKIEEFMEIGGSPVPGITLRKVLQGSSNEMYRIAWSPDGHYLASSGSLIWDTESGQHRSLQVGSPNSVSWSPDGKRFSSEGQNGDDKTIQIWDTNNWKLLNTVTTDIWVRQLTWSPDNRMLALSSDEAIQILDSSSLQKIIEIDEKRLIWYISWSLDSQLLAVSVGDRDLLLYDIKANKLLHKLSGHTNFVGCTIWSPDGQTIISSSSDKTIRLWDRHSGQQKGILEGHTSRVIGVCLSFDGRLMISRGGEEDNAIKIWNCKNWEVLAKLNEHTTNSWLAIGLSFHPNIYRFASLGNEDTIIRIWDIDYDVLIGNAPIAESVRYTTAKLVLAGDSGVGKTGLGWRLAYNEFKEHSSTHGQQFWVIPELSIKRQDGTECEAVLWDLAGQPDYRLVHSLYLDDVDTAMILFDPSNRQEPLAGVDFWLNQLKDKDKKLRNSILVGARTDRGTSTLTDAELQAFCERNGITGGYISTSAFEGKGLPELMEKLKQQIPWDQMTTTVTTVTFKRIKEFVLSLKEKTRRKKVLLQPFELRKQLEQTDRKWKFTDAEMMTAVGHLENHGYVKVLHGSNGEHSILLAPNLLVNLASSIILEARRNPRGLGVLEESLLLRGEYPFPELTKLHEGEKKILLDAAAVLFLEHNLCFRETFNQQTFLVFPSLINEKRPIDEALKTVEGATYQVKGAVENLYASMVVLLGYTNTFVRTHQWQNQAQYEMGVGEVCGFQQINYPDSSIELVLNYGEKTPDPVRLMFRGLFERFLSRRELEIARYQSVTCHKCGASLARNVVKDQLSKGKDFSFCHECGEKVSLPSPEALTRLSPKQEVELDTQQTIAKYRTAFEAALVRVKGLLRDQETEKKPSCFISYAWGVSENERWVLQLAKDLRNADIDVLFDRWHNPPGTSLTRFTDHILSSDFVVVVGTPKLREKYETQSQDPVVAAELRLINTRLRKPSKYGATVIPALIAGDFETSFTPSIQDIASIDFRTEEQHFVNLFNLIWRLYELPFDNPLLEELQTSMTPQQM